MLPPNEPVRLIQVGAGAMGRAWLRNIAEAPDVELVGLVDLDLDTARTAADDAGFTGVKVATSLEELAGRQKAHAIVNVTVPAAHHQVSTTAMLSGLPVLSEKPLAESVSQGLSMMAAAEVSGQLLMVSQSRRYWRNLSAFRRQIEQLGQLSAVTCEFLRGPHFGGFREVMPHPLLMDMAIHHFDLARALIGTEPLSVYCESYNPDWSWFSGDAAASAIFEFGGGIRFSYSGSWVSPGLETSWNGRWRVSGAEGTALWDGDHEPVAASAADETIAALLRDEPEQIAGSLAEFVHVLRSGATASTEVHSNLLSLAMVEAAIRSAALGQRVSIAAVLDSAYAQAVREETREDIRAALEAWPSVHQAVRQ